MTVLCGACSAENRDAAKFCKGCGRKIAQAWPQASPLSAAAGGASLPAAAVAAPPAHTPKVATTNEESRPVPAPARPRVGNGRWIVGLGIGVAVLVLATAWWGQRNKSPEIAEQAASPVQAPGASLPPGVEAGAPVPAAAVPAPAAAAAPLEAEDAMPPAAATQATTKSRKPIAKKQAPPPPAPVVEAAVPAPSPPAPEPVRVPTPQESCAGRNFIARAQCMAEQCARPEVARHPQCEAVRQQQRIEEEKRNPTMAG